MKIHLSLALVGLAISLALPTFAQQTNTPDPQVIEQLNASIRRLTRHLTTAMPPPWPRCSQRTRFL